MSGPNPIVIEFITKGVSEVLSSMQSIAGAVAKAEVASSTKASNERLRRAKQDGDALAREEQRRVDRNQKYWQAQNKKSFDYREKLVLDGERAEEKAHSRSSSKFRELHKKAADYRQRLVLENEKAEERSFAKTSQNFRALHQKAANERLSAGLTAEKRLAAEVQKIQLEQMRGVRGAAPGLAPSDRLAALHAAKGKAAHEQLATVEKIQRLGKENAALLQNPNFKSNQKAHQLDLKDAQRAEEQKTRDSAKAEKERASNAETIRKAHVRALRTYEAEQQRKAHEEESRREKFATNIMGHGSAAVGAATSITGRAAAGIFSAVSALGGGFTVEGALQENISNERQAALLANKAPGGKRPTAQVLAAAREISARTGTDTSAILGGMNAYMDKTGDFAGAGQNAEFFAKISKATGADLGQVGTAAGLLRVQNKNLNPAQMQQMLLDVVAQGRTGAVDFPELAGHVASITKTSGRYVGDQGDIQRRLIGLSQIGVRTGSTAEAATAISNLASDAGFHKDQIRAALGKDSINDDGQISKKPEEFIADIMEKMGGDPTKIMTMNGDKKVFGNRSIKLFDALQPTFNQARDQALKEGKSKTEANKAGKEAVLADMHQFTDAKYSPEEMQKDFAEIMKTSGEQFEGAIRNLKEQVGDALVPELKRLIPVLQALTPMFVDLLKKMTGFVELLAKNPFESFATVVTGFFIGELVKAKIAETIKQMISNSIPGGGGGGIGNAVGGAGGGSGIPGATGAAGASGFAVGGLTALGGAVQVGMMTNIADRAYQAYMGGTVRGGELANDMNDPSKRAGALAEVDQAKKDGSGWNVAAGASDYAAKMFMAVTNPLGLGSQYLGEKVGGAISGAAGMESKSTSDMDDQAIRARALVSSFDDINSSAMKTKNALDELAKAAEGASAASSGSSGSIAQRNPRRD